jgi:hypothetical protein
MFKNLDKKNGSHDTVSLTDVSGGPGIFFHGLITLLVLYIPWMSRTYEKIILWMKSYLDVING